MDAPRPAFKKPGSTSSKGIDNFRQPQRYRLAKLNASSPSSSHGSFKNHRKTPLGLPGSQSPQRPSNNMSRVQPHTAPARPNNQVQQWSRPSSPPSSQDNKTSHLSWSAQRRVEMLNDQGTSPAIPRKYYPSTDLKTKMATELTSPHAPALPHSTRADVPPQQGFAQSFTSLPLLPGLKESVQEFLGNQARPTPIQSLAVNHILRDGNNVSQTLLASETGSGKSIAYLLPLLQSLKNSEHLTHSPLPPTPPEPTPLEDEEPPSRVPLVTPGPRALVLAPTHELCRQLASSAKAMSHNIKLRVQCLSNPNRKRGNSSEMWDEHENMPLKLNSGSGRPIDVMVGTPSRVLALTGGVELSDRTIIGASERTWQEEERGEEVRVPESRMNLEHVEWVVVDEADVLFDRDFLQTTQTILNEVKMAREEYLRRASTTFAPDTSATPASDVELPETLPFNLILSSATIPVALSNYLETSYPSITRLASPKLHRLPKNLHSEHVQWTGGNRLADIYRKIEGVWAEDATHQMRVKAGIQEPPTGESAPAGEGIKKSKILIFCNEKDKVQKLGEYLENEKGVKCLTMVGDKQDRRKGSNQHLSGFLNPASMTSSSKSPITSNPGPSPASDPSILITTSLLSRGLDFSPSIKHVFVVDEPRSAVDFLHRAGRTGRAGRAGTVVLFEKGTRSARRGAKKEVAQSRQRIQSVL